MPKMKIHRVQKSALHDEKNKHNTFLSTTPGSKPMHKHTYKTCQAKEHQVRFFTYKNMGMSTEITHLCFLHRPLSLQELKIFIQKQR